ncbi:molybdate transport system ATP-binding protein [Formivibrio citricus]|uniref:Molybdate transport system ATP-binding protein n=1 Tax=Formivibrio citricus TaxID=83765 RepID=A0A1I4YYC6_9NEIS|nr:molybdenum ABC transporter ATP-binding protein [Formivibrio citricus]SFN43011.1 molybdate transport system ATP-binding protein [Formivibrio citricus]
MPQTAPKNVGIQIQLSLAYPAFRLEVDLDLPGRGVTALFGHSGSGKTTLLRCLAGLERAPQARIHVNGQCWQDGRHFVPTHKRALGYVFQEASLFPHLSVRKNLTFGQPASKDKTELEAMAERLGIAHLLDREPERLSGGERQRVAIARALLTRPQILLMDEPLAALDLKRKQEILPYLERLHDELEIPLVYVSHSPDEVARLADHLVLMNEGQVVASGPLQETLARIDLPAAFADDAGVVLDTTLGAHDEEDRLSRLDFPGGHLFVSQQSRPIGHKLRCRIHARDVSLALEKQHDTSILNLVPAHVTGYADTDNPANVLVRLDASGTPLLARITRRSLRILDLQPGKPVWAQIKAVALLD